MSRLKYRRRRQRADSCYHATSATEGQKKKTRGLFRVFDVGSKGLTLLIVLATREEMA